MRCVDLIDEVQFAVGSDDAERDGLPDGLDEVGDDRTRHLAQQQLFVGIPSQAQQLRPEHHAIVAGIPQRKPSCSSV